MNSLDPSDLYAGIMATAYFPLAIGFLLGVTATIVVHLVWEWLRP